MLDFNSNLENFNNTARFIKANIGKKDSELYKSYVNENGRCLTSIFTRVTNAFRYYTGYYNEKSQAEDLLKGSFEALKRSKTGKKGTVLERVEDKQIHELESRINHLNKQHIKGDLSSITEVIKVDEEQLFLAKDLDKKLEGLRTEQDFQKFLDSIKSETGVAYEEARAICKLRLHKIKVSKRAIIKESRVNYVTPEELYAKPIECVVYGGNNLAWKDALSVINSHGFQSTMFIKVGKKVYLCRDGDIKKMLDAHKKNPDKPVYFPGSEPKKGS